MGFFFRKRIKLFPGVSINLSKNGAGFSIGPKGLKYSVNSKGEEYINASCFGLHYREKLDTTSSSAKSKKQSSSANSSIDKCPFCGSPLECMQSNDYVCPACGEHYKI